MAYSHVTTYPRKAAEPHFDFQIYHETLNLQSKSQLILAMWLI